MGPLGTKDFSAGETTRARVSADGAVLERCSGYKIADRSLLPDDVAAQANSGDALSGTTPEQVPFAFRDGDDVTLIARDSAEKMRECVGAGDLDGVWAAAGDVCDILTESQPVRLGKQIIFCTGGTNPRTMVYEPGSSTTKLRPLSFKSPGDYKPGEKPLVTASTIDAVCTFTHGTDVVNITAHGWANGNKVWFTTTGTMPTGLSAYPTVYYIISTTANTFQVSLTRGGVAVLFSSNGTATTTAHTYPATILFDIDDGVDWAGVDGDYVAATVDDTVTLTLNSDTVANTKAFTKSLGATGVSLKNKAYLVFDIRIQNDTQPYYEIANLFANDPGLYASGYQIALYSDTTCVTEVAAYHIPRVQGVSRVAISIGQLSDTIKGVAILTAPFYKPPTDSTWIITLYSEDFDDDWAHLGNFLMPAVKWPQSPLAKTLSGLLTAVAGPVEIGLPGTNRMENPGFETGTGSVADDWTVSDVTLLYRTKEHPRSGEYSMYVVNYDGTGWIRSDFFVATAGEDVTVGFYSLFGYRQSLRRVTLTAYDAGDNVISSEYWPGAATWEECGSTIWEKWEKIWTPPAGTAKAKLTITRSSVPGARPGHMWIDDVYAYGSNQVTSGTAAILQIRAEDGSVDKIPGDPRVSWCYCFAGRDLLGEELWKLMVSNPSDPSREDPFIYADPWRTYALTVAIPGGPITAVAAAPTAGGTGYAVDDILYIQGGTDGKVKVASVNAGVVTGVTLLAAGTGYTTGAGKTTTNETDSTASGCTINISSALTPITEYGDYLTHILIYRQIYDGATGVWSFEEFVGSVAIDTSMTFTDSGVTVTSARIGGVSVPMILELRNDYLGSARHAIYSEGRVKLLGLDWDNENEVWSRPTDVAISSLGKPHAFPTIIDDDSQSGDGTELRDYPVTGSVGMGFAVQNNDCYVFLDTELFLLRGDNPLDGYRWIRLDSVPCISSRSIADCRGVLVWHSGEHFYAYSGGISRPISRFAIDSDLIDWTEPHGGLYCNGEYVFVCKTTDSEYACMRFDIESGAWRTRYSDALNVVGITTDGQDVYGVTPDGDCINLFGSTTSDYGAASTVREVWTRYIEVSDPGSDVSIGPLVIEADTDQESVQLDLEIHTQGIKNFALGTTTARTLTLNSTQTRYFHAFKNKGQAVKVKISYTGTTPPTIYYVGFGIPDTPLRGEG